MTRSAIRRQERSELPFGQPALNSPPAYAITEGLKVGNGQPEKTCVFLWRDDDRLIARLAANHHRPSLRIIQECSEVLLGVGR
jgi:hypothetical protein